MNTKLVADTKAKDGTAEYWQDQYMSVLKQYTEASTKLTQLQSEQIKESIHRNNNILSQWIAPIPADGNTPCSDSEMIVHSTNYGRQVHTWANDSVRVNKCRSADGGNKMVYQIALPRHNQAVNLKAETVQKVISALKVLLYDTSIETSYAKGAIIIDLKTGQVVNR